VDAELDESSVADVKDTEEIIVSQWRDISAGEKSQLREKVDEILRPLGLETRLLVMDRISSIALFFLCMTLSALMSLRDQWQSGQLKHTVESLYTFLSGASVRVKRLSWPESDFERCSEIHHSARGNKTTLL